MRSRRFFCSALSCSVEYGKVQAADAFDMRRDDEHGDVVAPALMMSRFVVGLPSSLVQDKRRGCCKVRAPILEQRGMALDLAKQSRPGTS